MSNPTRPDRNLALELVRVTEAAAMAAARWVGRGDKNDADQQAVNAMRYMISSVGMRGTVVIGEGEKDNAPMLFNGEEVGDGTGPECDVAVDPIDGTTLTAKGMNNAIAVLAVAPRHTMFDPSAVFYMEKLVTGPEAADVVDIRKPVAENIHAVAKAKDMHEHDVTVVLLDRPRHAGLVEEIRADRRPHQVHPRRRRRRRDHGRPAGHRRRPAARHRRHPGGDHRGVRDEVHGRRDPGPAVAQGRRGAAAGPRRRPRPRPRPILTTDQLVTGDDCFFVATGITDGELMKGVHFRPGRDLPLAGDALAQRHHPLDQRRAPLREAPRVLRDRLRALSRSLVEVTVTSSALATELRSATCPSSTSGASRAASTSRITRGSKASPAWEAVTSTGTASGSTQARQSTMPSRLE